jgi:hypothetical protein
MTWIAKRLEQQKQGEMAKTVAKDTNLENLAPAWKPVWDEILVALWNDVVEFNGRSKTEQFIFQHQPSFPPPPAHVHPIVSVVSAPGSKRVGVAVANLQVDTNTGKLSLNCPPEGAGVTRHGTFKIDKQLIEVVPGFVGTAPKGPMTPAQFSEFILDPLFFPTLQ